MNKFQSQKASPATPLGIYLSGEGFFNAEILGIFRA